MSADVAGSVRALVAEHAEIPADPDAPLELDSLTLIVITEALEERFGFQVAARELVPEQFGTLRRLVAFVERRRAR